MHKLWLMWYRVQQLSENTQRRYHDQTGNTVFKKTINEIKSARDFVPGKVDIIMHQVLASHIINRVIVDPDNTIEEIFEGNNVVMFQDYK